MNIYVGMTDEQRHSYTKVDFCKMKAKLDAKEMDRKEYIWFYTQYLMNFIKYRIREKTYISPTSQEYEDLLCDCIAAITEKIDAYDPNIAGPSTFFAPYIDEKIKDATRSKQISHYYNQMLTQLNQVAVQHGYEGINDEKLTSEALSSLAGISLITVIETRERAGYTLESLDLYKTDSILDEKMTSPEELFVAHEQIHMLSNALKECTPLEQFLLLSVEADRCSFRRILDVLKREEFRKHFPGEIQPKMTQEYLARKLRSGKTHMQQVLGRNRETMLNNIHVAVSEIHPTTRISIMDLLDELLED